MFWNIKQRWLILLKKNNRLDQTAESHHMLDITPGEAPHERRVNTECCAILKKAECDVILTMLVLVQICQVRREKCFISIFLLSLFFVICIFFPLTKALWNWCHWLSVDAAPYRAREHHTGSQSRFSVGACHLMELCHQGSHSSECHSVSDT